MPTVLDPVEVAADVDHGEPLVHLSFPPYTHGICGTPLKCQGPDWPDWPEATCVVCIDLDRHLP